MHRTDTHRASHQTLQLQLMRSRQRSHTNARGTEHTRQNDRKHKAWRIRADNSNGNGFAHIQRHAHSQYKQMFNAVKEIDVKRRTKKHKDETDETNDTFKTHEKFPIVKWTHKYISVVVAAAGAACSWLIATTTTIRLPVCVHGLIIRMQTNTMDFLALSLSHSHTHYHIMTIVIVNVYLFLWLFLSMTMNMNMKLNMRMKIRIRMQICNEQQTTTKTDNRSTFFTFTRTYHINNCCYSHHKCINSFKNKQINGFMKIFWKVLSFFFWVILEFSVCSHGKKECFVLS